MTIRDLLRNTRVTTTLSPAIRTNGTATGDAVDLRGFDSAVIVISFGTWTDGTHTPSVQHSLDGTSYANVAASDLDGSITAVNGADGSNTAQSVGYIGSQRYVRVLMTVSGATSGALSGASVIGGHPRVAPTK